MGRYERVAAQLLPVRRGGRGSTPRSIRPSGSWTSAAEPATLPCSQPSAARRSPASIPLERRARRGRGWRRPSAGSTPPSSVGEAASIPTAGLRSADSSLGVRRDLRARPAGGSRRDGPCPRPGGTPAARRLDPGGSDLPCGAPNRLTARRSLEQRIRLDRRSITGTLSTPPVSRAVRRRTGREPQSTSSTSPSTSVVRRWSRCAPGSPSASAAAASRWTAASSPTPASRASYVNGPGTALRGSVRSQAAPEAGAERTCRSRRTGAAADDLARLRDPQRQDRRDVGREPGEQGDPERDDLGDQARGPSAWSRPYQTR